MRSDSQGNCKNIIQIISGKKSKEWIHSKTSLPMNIDGVSIKISILFKLYGY